MLVIWQRLYERFLYYFLFFPPLDFTSYTKKTCDSTNSEWQLKELSHCKFSSTETFNVSSHLLSANQHDNPFLHDPTLDLESDVVYSVEGCNGDSLHHRNIFTRVRNKFKKQDVYFLVFPSLKIHILKKRTCKTSKLILLQQFLRFLKESQLKHNLLLLFWANSHFTILI